MKRVISFNIEKRKRDALLAFFRAVITASQGDEKVTALCSIQLAALIAAYQKMQELAERHQMNLLTPEVQDADEWRDANLSRFRAGVRAELKNPDPQKRRAAELLWKICEELGRIHNQAFDQQTGAMTTFCLDLEKNHPEDMALLGLSDAFATMKESNEAFIRILAERTEIEGSYEKGSPQKARAEAINAYRDFVMKLNTLLSEGHYAELAGFIDYLNAEIERQRIALGQRPGNTGTGEDREVVATFHFFDHTEEEVRQLVGSVLNPPRNTAGYIWDPKVPATMPAENTAYYELPVSSGEGGSGEGSGEGGSGTGSGSGETGGGGQEEDIDRTDPSAGQYSLVYRYADGETYAVHHYNAGERIVPIAPPAGYRWPDTLPTVMPADNVRIKAVAI